MALTNKLKNIAEAIRNKTGKNDLLTLEQMPTEIGSIKNEPVLQDKELTINENGTHNITADEGYDGLNQVDVTVNAIEDLTEKLTTYNEELTTQETTINDIVEALKNKTAIAETPSIFPLVLLPTVKNRAYSGVTTFTTNLATEMGYTPNEDLCGIVAIMVRSDYTLSDNLQKIVETDWCNYSDGTKQKLIICWCDNLLEDFTVTQVSSGRMAFNTVAIRNGKVKDIIFNEADYQFPTKTLPLGGGLTIYFHTTIAGSYPYYSNTYDQQSYFTTNLTYANIGAQRLNTFIFFTDKASTQMTNTLTASDGHGLIGLTIEGVQYE